MLIIVVWIDGYTSELKSPIFSFQFWWLVDKLVACKLCKALLYLYFWGYFKKRKYVYKIIVYSNKACVHVINI